eukprot:m.107861 g.107861  ORF g.107861 m.107861 type:complete len:275 (+) comp9181_c0_seq9:51-875(+)
MVGRRSSSFVPVLVLVLMGGFLYLVLYPPETQRQEDTRDVSSPSKDNEVEEPKKRFHRTENNFERLCKCDANACEYGKIFDKSPESCCVCVAVDRSPNVFHISMVTTKGEIIIEMHREWSPEGVDRVYELVKLGFCDTTETSRGLAFFRVVPNFVVQFGIHGDPSISSYWRNQHIPDDPVVESNLEGYLTFASAGPNTRTSQLFFNLVNNPFLDKSGFSPLGKIVSGLETLRQINSQYKEKPNQGQLQTTGQEYLDASFPNLDYITRCSIQEEP